MAEQQVPRPRNPEDDWKIWTVCHPGTWLMPILFAVLLIALAVHSVVLDSAKYNFLAG
jgi:light-harvesting protein B-800-850 alpha chain